MLDGEPSRHVVGLALLLEGEASLLGEVVGAELIAVDSIALRVLPCGVGVEGLTLALGVAAAQLIGQLGEEALTEGLDPAQTCAVALAALGGGDALVEGLDPR